jgi:hypothetical protein
MNSKILLLCIIFLFSTTFHALKSQSVPSSEENIPYLVTFGKDSKTAWGDEDFCQIFFFIIPKDEKKPVFIRVFDPETGGKFDEIKDKPDSKTKFSIFGGKGAYTDHDSINEQSTGQYNSGISIASKTNEQPTGHYNSGIPLASKTFDNQKEYDGKWFTFGPFNPSEGEYVEKYGGNIIKIIAEGSAGNDGNLYKYFLSTDPVNNIKVEGSNAVTFEYTFRLNDQQGNVSHIYPFVNRDVLSVEVHTYDYDYDGIVRIVSVSKKSELIIVSGDDQWASSRHKITDLEKNTSLDIQMIKTTGNKNNNVVFYITNQYNSRLPFFTSPIGGVPKYNYKIGVRPQR